jgi:hypothetical protein
MPFEKGHKHSKGRPTKAQEAKANQIMLNALKELYSLETDDEAKKEFIKETLMTSQRGQIFIAEHIFGKPKETIDQNVTLHDFKVSDLIKFKGD